MDLEGIVDFITLAEVCSFSKAARLRMVTQPAFSRRIQSLEYRLGAALVDRTSNPVVLTQAGERFLVHARLLKKTLEKAVEEAQSQISALVDPVHIVTSHSLSVNVFPHWYRDLQRQMPDLRVRLASQRIERCVLDISEGTADLAIIHYTPQLQKVLDLGRLQTKTIGLDTLIPVVAKHQAKQAAHGLLAYAPGSYLGACSETILCDLSVKKRPQTVFENPSGEVLRSMALAGFGMACLTETLIEDDLKAEFLVPALPMKHRLDLSILLIRNAKPLSAMSEAVWQLSQPLEH